MNIKYEAPQMEIIEVNVEHGFSASLGFTNDSADNSFDIM